MEKLQKERAEAFLRYVWADKRFQDAEWIDRNLACFGTMIPPIIAALQHLLDSIRATAAEGRSTTLARFAMIRTGREQRLEEILRKAEKLGLPPIEKDPHIREIDRLATGCDVLGGAPFIPESSGWADRKHVRASMERFFRHEQSLRERASADEAALARGEVRPGGEDLP